jgi:hypothetical protein
MRGAHATRRVALAVWSSSLVVPFAFLALADEARWRGQCPAPAGAVFWISTAVTALAVTLSRLLPARLPPFLAGREASAFSRLLLGWALCEAGAFFPLVSWIVSGDSRLVGVFGVALLALVLLYPSDHRWESLAPSHDPVSGRIR